MKWMRLEPRRSMTETFETPSPPAERAGWKIPWPAVGAQFKTRVGLEGKILTLLMTMLIASIGACCWVWATRIDQQINSIMGEQARQVAGTLAMATRSRLAARDSAFLSQIGTELLKTRNILFVAFYDEQGRTVSLSDRDPAGRSVQAAPLRPDVESLTQVQRGTLQTLGDFLQVSQPVLEFNTDGTSVSRLVGYVSVGISPTREQLQVRRVNFLAAGIGCMMVLVSFPMAYLLVHRIFTPIRELVAATNRIARDDLETQVAMHRHDAIGDLARAFNEMVKTVKRQRQDLRHANRQLEQRVTERTSQLETANKRLSAEIAEKEDFLRAVSHDLNAPLRNIAGMASMLLTKHRQTLDDEAIHRLDRIQKNVETEMDLISELLELSRIKTQRQRMELVEIGPLLRDLEGLFDNDLKSRQIKLVIDTELPVLHGEKTRFRQIFQNLIDNAIKYMGDGPTREIHVGCEVRPNEAEFYVRDTGLGIDSDDIGKVFFVFRRGRNSTSRKIAGKGVGLSSVKCIVETYSGSIWVESQIGKGTTFRFTINGQHVPAAQSRSEKSSESSAAVAAVRSPS